MSSATPIIEAVNIYKTFGFDELGIEVLKDISFQVAQGERVAIVGASGSGKSTLLHLLGGLDMPTSGEARVAGTSFGEMKDAERGRFRNEKLGFVYQFHHLLPEFSALENVAMPLLIRGDDTDTASKLATKMLEQVGLGHRVRHRPSELSGGERQRAAIARAMVTQPQCILADEPTGNLDTKTAESVYELMLTLNIEANTGFIIVTHDVQLANKMDRILNLADGRLAE